MKRLLEGLEFMFGVMGQDCWYVELAARTVWILNVNNVVDYILRIRKRAGNARRG